MAITTPDIPPVTGGVQIFRSCLISTEYPGVEAATKWLFDRFDIEYIVNPDQTCCTGLGYYTDMMPFPTTAAMSARNSCVAVEAGHPIQSYLCSTCYAINKKARNVLEVPEYRRATNEVLATIGREYDDDVAGADPPHAHARDPLEPPSVDPRSHQAPPRRHQGRHAPRLPLLQGLPRRGHRRQRELHDPRGPARADRRDHRPATTTRRRPTAAPASASASSTRRSRRPSRARSCSGWPRRASTSACTCARTAPSQFDRHHDDHRATSPARSTRSCTCTCSSSSPWRSAPTPTRSAASARTPRTSSRSSSASALAGGSPWRARRRSDEVRRLSLRVRRQHLGRARPRGAGRRRAGSRRRRPRRHQPVHVRHRGRGQHRARPSRSAGSTTS